MMPFLTRLLAQKNKELFWCGLLLYGGYLLLKETAAFSLIYLFRCPESPAGSRQPAIR